MPPFNKSEYTSSNQQFVINDSRRNRDGHKWEINAAASRMVKVSDPSVSLQDDPLYYNHAIDGQKHLTRTAVKIHEHVVDVSDSEDNWVVPWNLKVKIDPIKIPQSGRYKGTVVFTLVDIYDI